MDKLTINEILVTFDHLWPPWSCGWRNITVYKWL